jgi:hypothetical protein
VRFASEKTINLWKLEDEQIVSPTWVESNKFLWDEAPFEVKMPVNLLIL